MLYLISTSARCLVQYRQIFSSFLISCFYFIRLKARVISCKIRETRKIFPILYLATCDNNYILLPITMSLIQILTIKRIISQFVALSYIMQRKRKIETSVLPITSCMQAKIPKYVTIGRKRLRKCSLLNF